MHDPAFDDYRRITNLTDIGLNNLSGNSPTYYMAVYPSKAFFDVFSTENPTVATAGTVSIIIFTSILFFLYDCLVSKENRKHQASIEGRRSTYYSTLRIQPLISKHTLISTTNSLQNSIA